MHISTTILCRNVQTQTKKFTQAVVNTYAQDKSVLFLYFWGVFFIIKVLTITNAKVYFNIPTI